MPPLRRRKKRVDLIVLGVVAVAVMALLLSVFTRMQENRAEAAVQTYPQLTQAPPTIAVQSVAFIGDSYSAGTGSTGYNTRFTTLVSAYEGWASQSFAYGGTGYLRTATTSAKTGCGSDYCPSYGQVIARVKAYDPTLVVVSGGRNDVNLDETQVETAISDFYTALRTTLPQARIVATSPLWAYTQPPAQLARIQQAVRSNAARVGATYLDLGQPLVDDQNLTAPDRVHPNNRGHAEIARLIEVALSNTPEATPLPASPSATPVP